MSEEARLRRRAPPNKLRRLRDFLDRLVANEEVERPQTRLRAFAHGDHDLLVRHRGAIARRVDAGDGDYCSAQKITVAIAKIGFFNRRGGNQSDLAVRGTPRLVRFWGWRPIAL